MSDNRFYVYLLLDPRNYYLPFYVGKGTGRRCFQHLIKNYNPYSNPYKTRKINNIRKSGYEPIVMIWQDNLEEDIALNLEETLIKRFGRKCDGGILTNLLLTNNGGKGHIPETIEKLRIINTGKVLSDETKRKISISMKEIANNRPPELIQQQTERMKKCAKEHKGKKWNDNRRKAYEVNPPVPTSEMKEHLRQVMKGRKTSDGMLGKHHTEDSKMKSRETHKIIALEKRMNDFYSYDEAKVIIKSLNIKDKHSYKTLDKEINGKKLPSEPRKFYLEWNGWAEFLGV